jgi:hypothetical protein
MITLLAVYGAGFSYHCPLSAQNSEESVSVKSLTRRKRSKKLKRKLKSFSCPKKRLTRNFFPTFIVVLNAVMNRTSLASALITTKLNW